MKSPNVEVTAVSVEGCGNTFVMTRTYTATDACGNTDFDIQIITVVDTTAPGLLADDDVTIECDAIVPIPFHVVEDICDDNPTVDVTAEIIEGCGSSYVMTRTYTATDACGNQTVETQVITVVDTTAPDMLVGDDMTIECDAVVPAPEYFVEDNCDETVDAEVTSETVEGCGSSYVMTRTYTATDGCGNQTVETQVITVVDTTAPEMIVGDDMTIECDAVLPETEYFAEDNCDEVVPVVVTSETVEGCGSSYIMTRTYTATDGCGNETVETQVITVVDTTAPEMLVGDNMTIECDATVPAPEYFAEDNCDEVVDVVVTSEIVEGCGASYVMTRTYTATDGCGNQTVQTQVITVVDNTAPTFDSVLSLDITVECNMIPDPSLVTASDNCDEDVTVTYADIIFGGGCIGVIERTWTATDECNNMATMVQFIQLVDNTAPILTGVPNDIAIPCNGEIPEVPAGRNYR